MTITIYSTTNCASCHALMQWLDQKEVAYTNKVVDRSDADMDEFMSVNEGLISTPFTVIETNDQTHKVQGFDRTKIEPFVVSS